MAEIKRTFTAGRMNQDVDERLVPNGEYRTAMNVEIRTSESDDAGTVQNVMGNVPFAYLLQDSGAENQVIGSIADERNNRAFYLVKNSLPLGVTSSFSPVKLSDAIIEVSENSSYFDKISNVRRVVVDTYATLIPHFSVDTYIRPNITGSANSNVLTITNPDVYKVLDYFEVGMTISLFSRAGVNLLPDNTKIVAIYNSDDNENPDTITLNNELRFSIVTTFTQFSSTSWSAGSNGQTTIPISNTTGLSIGDHVYESSTINTVVGATIKSISTNTSIVLDKEVAAGSNKTISVRSSNLHTISIGYEPVLDFRHTRSTITGLNIVDDFLFITSGFSEPLKINIPRCIEGTPQPQAETTFSSMGSSINNPNTNLFLYNNINRNFEETGKKLLKEHITVIRKAPRTAPMLDMSASVKAGENEFAIGGFDFTDPDTNILRTLGSTITIDLINFSSVYDVNFIVGDIYNAECVNDEDDSPSLVRLRVSDVNSDSQQVQLEIIFISPTILVTHNQWIFKLEQPKPLFELKFPRFGYRYKYSDGEYSSFSPFSEVAFLPGEYDYEPRKGFNLGMTNNLRELKITNIIPGGIGYSESKLNPDDPIRPDDVVAIDILYKSTDSPSVYVAKTIERFKDDEFSSGIVNIKSEMLHNIVPSNQILRSWDNVPLVAKAQEVIGNRLVFANYIQGYDVGETATLDVGLESCLYNFTNEACEIPSLANPLKSIKSLRSYKVGVVYGDRYGRETPVIPTGTTTYRSPESSEGFSSENINLVDVIHTDSISLDKEESPRANRITVKQNWEKLNTEGKATVFEPRSYFDYVKYYIKETSTEYYNLVMDRWYDAEDGNIWLSFQSADRNKLDEETYIILKVESGSDSFVPEEARYKILAISSEAPNFIKTSRLSIGSEDININDIDYSASTLTEEELIIKTQFTHTGENLNSSQSAFKGQLVVRIKAFSRDSNSDPVTTRFSNYKKVTNYSTGDDPTFEIETPFGEEAKFAEYFINIQDYAGGGLSGVDQAGDETRGVKYEFQFKDETVENKPEFDGKFFAKIQRDGVLNDRVLGIGTNNAEYRVTKIFKVNYIDPNSVNHPSVSGESAAVNTAMPNINYNFGGSGFYGTPITAFDPSQDPLGQSRDVTTRFAGAILADQLATKDFWAAYASQDVTFSGGSIFIDAADIVTGGGFYSNPTNVGDSGLLYFNTDTVSNLNPNWSDRGSDRGITQSGNLPNGTRDRIYFGKVGDDSGNPLSYLFGQDNSAGDSLIDTFSVGSYFRFKLDPNPDSIYKVVFTSNTTIGKNYTEQYTIPSTGVSNGGTGVIETSSYPLLSDEFEVARRRHMFYIDFRRVSADGSITNEGIDFSDFDPRGVVRHDGSGAGIAAGDLVIEIVEKVDLEEVSRTTGRNSAIWETEPKDSVDLDIYYEASGAIPLRIDDDNLSEFAPIGSKVTIHYGINYNSQYRGKLKPVQPKNCYVADTFTKGILSLRYEKSETEPRALVTTYGQNKEFIAALDVLCFHHGDGTETFATVTSYQQIAASIVNAPGYGPPLESGETIFSSTSAPTGYYKIDKDVFKNKVILPWSNCYSYGNGVECNRIRDDFNTPFIDNGVKVSSVFTGYSQENITNGFIYSGIYNSNSKVNNLNEFNMSEKITKEINPSYGSIQILKTRDTDLITFTEDKVLRVLANKDALFNADGNANLTASDRVLGQAVPYVGDYGISRNPESLAVDQFRMYFTDKERGAVLRLSRDGLTPISNVGMRNYFRNKLKISKELIGSFDTVTGEYNLTIKNDDIRIYGVRRSESEVEEPSPYLHSLEV